MYIGILTSIIHIPVFTYICVNICMYGMYICMPCYIIVLFIYLAPVMCAT